MKISYNWLKQYVDFILSPEDLAEVLTGVGLEVEDITPYESIPGGLKDVVIGEVKECMAHPNADKLSITQVDVGGPDLLQIVCGAPNVSAGQKVVVALTGAVLYPSAGEKLQIKKAKIRSVESNGMICAEDEIGLSDNHAGIMVLDQNAKVGTPASEYFKVESDFVLDIGLTPNRGDANSHIGVARDVAAALNIAYKAKVNFTKPAQSSNLAKEACGIEVEVQDTNACPRYSALTIAGVKVGPSPSWLKNRLSAIGVRSINNVVDITNYVLHEYGQPLHAFDADKIRGKKVIVKQLPTNTIFKTLDEREIKLDSEDLMICDSDGGMCIAGVFGGAESGVSDDTRNIFLESGYFSPTGIRRTSMRHGLRTDAATHFEKGCDPQITVAALLRAASLIEEICGGRISSSVTDIYPTEITGWNLEISTKRMLRLAGFSLDVSIIREILQRLEIKIESESEDIWQLIIPAFKTDVKREADVVEEILRIYGYNSFTLPRAVKSSLTFSAPINAQRLENTVADMLSGAGFNEVWTNSVSQSRFEEDQQLKQQQVMLLNSQTAELDSLRTSMLYSVLEVIAYNQNRKQTDLRFYEFGKTYRKTDSGYKEQQHLCLFLTGKTFEQNWIANSEAYNFYHLKTYTDQVLSKLGHQQFAKAIHENLPFDFSLAYSNENAVVANLGSVARSVLRKFDIKNEVFFAELNWSYLLEKSQFAKTSFSELPKFPSVRRDLAMVVNEELPFESLEKIAMLESKKLLQEISLFDVYKGEKVGKGKKSYAVSFVFRHPEKTLTDAEIEKVMGRLMQKYESELGAVIRKA